MNKFVLSGLLLASMSFATLAAEPLTEKQMDTVTAGLTVLDPFTVYNLTVTPTTFHLVADTFFILDNAELYTPSFLQALSGVQGSGVFMAKRR